uniref:BioF2-like acetyltransferase domain-containing protein n=3 Tax=unclassified Prevotella TaxID=2638335 RepID=A0AB33J4P4_9BACT
MEIVNTDPCCELQTTSNLLKIRSIWKEIYDANEKHGVFQEYFYNQCIWIQQFLRSLGKKRYPLFAVIYEHGEPLLIAPLSVSWKRENQPMLFNEIQGCDVAEFIYRNNITDEQLDACIDLLTNRFGTIKMTRFDTQSKIYRRYIERYPDIEQTFYPYVDIPFGNSHDDYLRSLSKSTRQNLRTSYNRLKSDGREFHFAVEGGRAFSLKEWSKFYFFYTDRQQEKYRKYKGIKKYTKMFTKHDCVSIRNSSSNFIATLYYEEKIAALLMGLVSRDGTRVVVPWLAIDGKLGRYSPGYQLVNETIKYCMEHTQIRHLDLSRGDEGYKLTMGGRLYYTAYFEMKKRT